MRAVNRRISFSRRSFVSPSLQYHQSFARQMLRSRLSHAIGPRRASREEPTGDLTAIFRVVVRFPRSNICRHPTTFLAAVGPRSRRQPRACTLMHACIAFTRSSCSSRRTPMAYQTLLPADKAVQLVPWNTSRRGRGVPRPVLRPANVVAPSPSRRERIPDTRRLKARPSTSTT